MRALLRNSRLRVTWMALLTSLLVGFAGLGSAQSSEPRVTAQLSSGVVRLGETATIRFEAENVRSGRVAGELKVDGLTFGQIQGPSRNQVQIIVNGRRRGTSSLTWSVGVRPEREGEFEIPALTLELDGRLFATRSLNLKVVRDLAGADLGFIELKTAPASRLVEGMPFTLEVLFGWDDAAGMNYANLVLPWWEEFVGALTLEDPALTPPTVRGVSVNDAVEIEVSSATPVERDGRTYRTLRVVRRFLPTRAGQLEIPASFLEFGKLSRSRSLFGGSRKTQSFFVEAPAMSLEVVPLPTANQPINFGGAVGAFDARATVDARDVRVGDSLKFTVTWTGSGNLEFFEAPDPSHLDSFGGFRYYGKTERKSFDRREVTYDLAPLSPEVNEIPALPLSVFEPGSGQYVQVTTDPIPVRVRALDGAAVLEDEETRFERDIHDLDIRALAGPTATSASGRDASPRGPSNRAVAGAFALTPLLWLGLRTAVRKRRGDPDAPAERRRRRAKRELSRALRGSSEPEVLLRAFGAFLAARTREPDAAWIGRDRGASPELGLKDEAIGLAEDVLGRLEAAAYGAGPAVPSTEIADAANRLMGMGL